MKYTYLCHISSRHTGQVCRLDHRLVRKIKINNFNRPMKYGTHFLIVLVSCRNEYNHIASWRFWLCSTHSTCSASISDRVHNHHEAWEVEIPVREKKSLNHAFVDSFQNIDRTTTVRIEIRASIPVGTASPRSSTKATSSCPTNRTFRPAAWFGPVMYSYCSTFKVSRSPLLDPARRHTNTTIPI